jgi:hypothetical protein
MGQQWVKSPTGVASTEVSGNEDEDEHVKILSAGYHGSSFN